MWCFAELGMFARGMAYAEELICIVEPVKRPYEQVSVARALGVLHLRQGDLPKAVSFLERGVRLCLAADLPTVLFLIAPPLGYAYALSGRCAEAVSLLEQVVEQTRAMRFVAFRSLWVAWLSEAYLLAGRMEDAAAHAQRALELSQAISGKEFTSSRR
jgi:tetratricopeptide (TPR) repeat protein